VADTARPGHFVALSIGGSETSMLLRRSFSLHRASVTDGTIEVIVADAGRAPTGSARGGRTTRSVWSVRWGSRFPIPAEPVSCTLVGGGYGSAPLFWLAEVLRDKGCSVEVVLGAATEQRLFDAPRPLGSPPRSSRRTTGRWAYAAG
jgi:dihydroorotate dehydrogenase electron transfer subunit